VAVVALLRKTRTLSEPRFGVLAKGYELLVTPEPLCSNGANSNRKTQQQLDRALPIGVGALSWITLQLLLVEHTLVLVPGLGRASDDNLCRSSGKHPLLPTAGDPFSAVALQIPG
jgi:hypothetical protein